MMTTSGVTTRSGLALRGKGRKGEKGQSRGKGRGKGKGKGDKGAGKKGKAPSRREQQWVNSNLTWPWQAANDDDYAPQHAAASANVAPQPRRDERHYARDGPAQTAACSTVWAHRRGSHTGCASARSGCASARCGIQVCRCPLSRAALTLLENSLIVVCRLLQPPSKRESQLEQEGNH